MDGSTSVGVALASSATTAAGAADTAAAIARAQEELTEWAPLLLRHWSRVESLVKSEGRDLGDSFRVLSFNILADSKQCEEKWEATPPQALEWSFRRWRLLEEILVHDADIICLQELDHIDDFFHPELCRLGYKAVVRRRPAPAEDAVAVFFRAARFDLCEEDTSLDYAAVACLADRRSAARLVVVSAHLKPGKDAASESTRAAQANGLLELAAVFAARGWRSCDDGEKNKVVAGAVASRAEVLIAADLNAEPQVDSKIGDPLAYRAMRSHNLGLRSAYAALPEAVPMDGGSMEPPYTTRKRRPKGEIKRTIDFIFHSAGLDLAALLKMPSEEEMPDERVPTYSYPSDHFALAADFRSMLSVPVESA